MKTTVDMIADLEKSESLVTTAIVGADPFVVSIISFVERIELGESVHFGARVRCGQCGRINGPSAFCPAGTSDEVRETAERRQRDVAVRELDRHVWMHERQDRIAEDPFYGIE